MSYVSDEKSTVSALKSQQRPAKYWIGAQLVASLLKQASRSVLKLSVKAILL